MDGSGSGTPTLSDVLEPQQVQLIPTLESTESESGADVLEVEVEEEESEYETRCELEGFTRFSESHIWKIMMSFYDKTGVESWSHGIVPYFITCNAFIGRGYARVLAAYLADCMRQIGKAKLNKDEKLYILELGAGSGKFSFFMLKALQEMSGRLAFPFSNIVYVMTDFTTKNFDFWDNHQALKPFIKDGHLDMCIFDASKDTSMTLAKSKTVLRPQSCVNPICVVANYLFDTLSHDMFQVSPEGELLEGLISVGTTRAVEEDPLDPEIIKRMDNRFEYRSIAGRERGPGTCYPEEEDGADLESVLQWYVDYSKNGQGEPGCSFLLPVGALRVLRLLRTFTKGGLLVLSGDKGNNAPSNFRGISNPHIAVHGSFSVMVNYHAIGAYCIKKGGFAVHNPQEEASLKVSAFVLPGNGCNASDLRDGSQAQGMAEMERKAWKGGELEAIDRERAASFPELAAAFDVNIVDFGPNDFFVMQKCLKEESPTPSLKCVLSLLKLGDWDPDVFFKFRDIILNQVPTAGHKLKKDLCRGIPRVWENYYALDKDKDIAFEVGRFYYGIKDYDQALRYYKESYHLLGEHHVTYHNMGLCFYSSGNYDEANRHFDLALGLNSSYQKSQLWKEKVLNEKQRRSGDIGLEEPMVQGEE